MRYTWSPFLSLKSTITLIRTHGDKNKRGVCFIITKSQPLNKWPTKRTQYSPLPHLDQRMKRTEKQQDRQQNTKLINKKMRLYKITNIVKTDFELLYQGLVGWTGRVYHNTLLITKRLTAKEKWRVKHGLKQKCYYILLSV